MTLFNNTFHWLVLPVTFALTASGCGISTIGGGTGGTGGSGGGSGGGSTATGGSSSPCSAPDPSSFRCDVHADCGPAEICSTAGCAPSGCECDAQSGEWLCTLDCNHACAPDPRCAPPDTVTCGANGECPDGYECNPNVCAAESCECQAEGSECSPTCIPVCTAGPICATPNPAAGACITNDDCLADETCVEEGCQPASCVCDAGTWMCDDGCVGHCTPK